MPFHAGSFLVARPTLKDPFFGKTVVLLLQHQAEGAFGLIINRPLPVEDLSSTPLKLYLGGPCDADGLLLLHGHRDWLADPDHPGPTEVAPGIFLGDSSVAERITENPDEPLRYRVFKNYSGWGPGQLESELASGVWAIVPANGELLFDTPVEAIWAAAMPSLIPPFSQN